MKFNVAISRHASLERSYSTLAANPEAKIAFEGAWNAITRTKRDKSAMACSVRTGLPINYIPLMISLDFVPAVYFCECLSKEMLGCDPKVFSDTLECSNILAQAIAMFEKRRQQADNIKEGFGCGGDAAWAVLRKCDDQSNSHHLKTMIEDIANMAGRIFETMNYHGIPVETDDPDFVSGIETGEEIDRLTDEERGLLTIDGPDLDVLSRLDDQQAQQIKMQGETQRGRGPLVIALDSSGSMHRHRQVWSKAVAVALARIAGSENRAIRIVHWSSETVIQDFEHTDPSSIVELARIHLSGWTNVDTAMRVSISSVGALERKGFPGADLVFVTDGEANYSENWFKDELPKNGIRLWTIAIQVDIKNLNCNHLATYATKYFHIDDSIMQLDAPQTSIVNLKQAAMTDLDMN